MAIIKINHIQKSKGNPKVWKKSRSKRNWILLIATLLGVATNSPGTNKCNYRVHNDSSNLR